MYLYRSQLRERRLDNMLHAIVEKFQSCKLTFFFKVSNFLKKNQNEGKIKYCQNCRKIHVAKNIGINR